MSNNRKRIQHFLLVGFGDAGENRLLRPLLEVYGQSPFRLTILETSKDRLIRARKKVPKSCQPGFPIACHLVEHSNWLLPKKIRIRDIDFPDSTLVYLAIPPKEYVTAIRQYSGIASTFAVEKPLATNEADLDELRDLNSRTDLCLRPIDHYWFKPVLSALEDQREAIARSFHWRIDLTEPRLPQARPDIIREGIVHDMISHVAVILERLLELSFRTKGPQAQAPARHPELLNLIKEMPEPMTLLRCTGGRSQLLDGWPVRIRPHPSVETAAHITMLLTIPGLHRKLVDIYIGKGIDSRETQVQLNAKWRKSTTTRRFPSSKLLQISFPDVAGAQSIICDLSNNTLKTKSGPKYTIVGAKTSEHEIIELLLENPSEWPIPFEFAYASTILAFKITRILRRSALFRYSHRTFWPRLHFTPETRPQASPSCVAAFIFDLDGVLAPLSQVRNELNKHLVTNWAPSGTIVRGQNASDWVENVYLRRPDTPVTCLISRERFQDYYHRLFVTFLQSRKAALLKTKVYIGARAILRFAANCGIHVAVLSRYPHSVIEMVLTELDLKRYCYFVQSRVGCDGALHELKDAFGILMRNLDVKEHQCILFDNKAENLAQVFESYPSLIPVCVGGSGKRVDNWVSENDWCGFKAPLKHGFAKHPLTCQRLFKLLKIQKPKHVFNGS
jgi:beta-phosphoglucomutase-like phosphatase (HAD superfamily)